MTSSNGTNRERAQIPNDFMCPITREVMLDPVVTPSGHTYEREAILQYLRHSSRDPLTRAPLTRQQLIPVRALQSTIEQWLKEHPQADNEQLEEAIKRNDKVMLDKYFRLGGDVNAEIDIYGNYNSALVYACVAHDDEALVKKLLDHGANVGFCDYHYSTALVETCLRNRPNSVRITKLLLAKGSPVDVSDLGDWTALMHAVKSSAMLTELLLEYGADVNFRNPEGRTALFYARAEAIPLLVNTGADLEAVDENGNTALLYMISLSYAEDALKLLEYNVNPAACNHQRQTAAILFAESGCSEYSLLEKLLACGINMNAQDRFGNTALMYATNPELAKLLIAYGADITIENNEGKTVKQLAQERGHKEIADNIANWPLKTVALTSQMRKQTAEISNLKRRLQAAEATTHALVQRVEILERRPREESATSYERPRKKRRT